MNRLKTRTNPLTKTWENIWHENGTLYQRKTPEGTTTTYFYDDANRLTKIDYPTETDIVYKHDKNGNITNAVNDKAVSLKYDAMDRLEEVISPYGDTVKYQYNRAGNLEKLTYPNGKYVKYHYYKNNWLQQTDLRDWAGKYITYYYNKNGRLRTLQHMHDGTVNQSFISRDKEGRTSAYTYNTRAGRIIDRSIERDALGHKIREHIKSGFEPPSIAEPNVYTRTPNNANQIQDINGDPFTYTDNGNLSDNSRWKTFGYNEENRLSDSTEKSASYQNTYDALGGRCFTYIHRNLEKSAAEYTLNYATPTKRVLKENITSDITRYNGTHVEREDTYYYIWGANGLAARIDTIGRLQYYYADDQGNILALTDADNGTPLREYFYLPYGDYVSPASGFYNPFSYSGSYGVYNLSSLCRHTYNPSISYINFAPDGNLYHAGARHYHSHFKTWLTPDGIGTLGQIGVGELNNLYLYGRGAPNVYVDPNGEFANFAIGAGIGGAVGAGAAWWRGDSILAGAAGGAIAGAAVGSGSALVAAALKAGSIGYGAAITTIGGIGGVSSAGGNAVEQVAGGVLNGKSLKSSVASIDPKQVTISGTAGLISGGVAGGGVVLKEVVRNSGLTAARNLGGQAMTRAISSVRNSAYKNSLISGLVEAEINTIQRTALNAATQRGSQLLQNMTLISSGFSIGSETIEEFLNPYNYSSGNYSSGINK